MAGAARDCQSRRVSVSAQGRVALLDQQVKTTPHTAAAGLADWCVDVGFHSDRGRVRGNNEDNLLLMDLSRGGAVDRESPLTLTSAGVLLAVADGMGGVNGGEMASRICVETLSATMNEPGGETLTPAEWRTRLHQGIGRASQAIHRHAAGDESLQGMGTTLTAVLITPQGGNPPRGAELFVAQVGDSRCYLGRDRTLAQITRDQTVWETMLDSGQDPDAALEQAPWTNMLMQAVGTAAQVEEVVSERALQSGDWIVLCTDGLYRVVEPGDVAGILHRDTTPPEKARELVALANERGGPDNITVIVCQVRLR